jgi:hypothetical protein
MPQRLTVWIVLLVVLFGPVQAIFTLRVIFNYGFEPYESVLPNLWVAILIRHVLLGMSMLIWVYTAWVLFRGRPATLKAAQVSLLAGAAFRIIGMFSVAALGGLPREISQEMLRTDTVASIGAVLETGACYLYLTRSRKVRAIYAAQHLQPTPR